MKVDTRPDQVKLKPGKVDELKELVNSYQGLVFDGAKEGCMKVPLVHLKY